MRVVPAEGGGGRRGSPRRTRRARRVEFDHLSTGLLINFNVTKLKDGRRHETIRSLNPSCSSCPSWCIAAFGRCDERLSRTSLEGNRAMPQGGKRHPLEHAIQLESWDSIYGACPVMPTDRRVRLLCRPRPSAIPAATSTAKTPRVTTPPDNPLAWRSWRRSASTCLAGRTPGSPRRWPSRKFSFCSTQRRSTESTRCVFRKRFNAASLSEQPRAGIRQK